MGWWLESCARKLEDVAVRDQELVIERSHWVRVAGVGVKVIKARRDDVGGRTCR